MTTDSTHEARIVPGEAEALAQRFHETYERLAPSFGYETREARAKPWADVPDQNKRLMIAVCGEILATPSAPPADLEAESRELLAAEITDERAKSRILAPRPDRYDDLRPIHVLPALRAIQRALSARQIAPPTSVEADAIVREMRAEGQMVGGTNSRAKIRQRITAWADRITRLSGGEVEW